MKISILILSLLFPILTRAQNFPEPNYPKDEFISPVHIPLFLAGNFGELRPGHFHEGLDIKTKGAIGYRVYAAADGYISRVAVSHTGYGNVIYITHPNGYTTVYGHLHSFNPKLASYVKKQQYKQESWKIDLSLSPNLFPVHQNDFIALSGATGGVSGPHVHFEIRDTPSEHPLNGLLWGFDITDRIPPSVFRISVYDRSQSIYEQTPKMLQVSPQNGYYAPAGGTVIVHADKVGFGVQTLDKQNNTHNLFGVYQGILYADDVAQNGFQLDNIGYEETRYVDAHYDYKSYIQTQKHYQLLFDLPGNKLPIYYNFSGNGSVDISDGKVHAVKIVIKDAYGNASTVRFNIKKGGAAPAAAACENSMRPDIMNIFENDQVQFDLEPGTLYDQICFQYKKIPTSAAGYYSDIQRIHNNAVPLYHFFNLRIKPDKTIPGELKTKLIFVNKDTHGKTLNIIPATLAEDGWAEAVVRSFGDYSIQTDTQAPVLTPVNIHDGATLTGAGNIQFTISDDKSGIKSYRAELDGKWLMFSRKKNTITYTFDEKCSRGDHTLKLFLTDNVDNITVKTYHFKR